jgi:CheY-like chemotaxis protein
MQKKRILVVEDNMDSYRLVRIILEKNGVSAANNNRLTARVSQSDRLCAFKAGCDDCIAKPVNLNKLVKCVERWLGNPWPENCHQSLK